MVKRLLKFLYYYFLIKKSGFFDKSFYLEKNKDLDHNLVDPLKHFLVKGGFEGFNPSQNFNSSWYLNTYKDVNNSEFNPLVHYLIFGIKEGRFPNEEEKSKRFVSHDEVDKTKGLIKITINEAKTYFIKGKARFKNSCPTVLVVSHEASLTGAPLLSLNIAQRLKQNFNVISILLKSGDLFEIFRETSTLVISPPTHSLFNYSLLEEIIDNILQKYSIKFAIINSIESRAFLKPLSSRFVPTIHLIHEFAAYTQPMYAFLEASLWSYVTIYSTSITYENALMVHPTLAQKQVEIIPQGKCDIPRLPKNIQHLKNGDNQFENLMDVVNKPSKSPIVLGVGFVHLRKGIDLFIACAAKTAEKIKDVKFLWIGDGYDPINDVTYSAYLAEQIHRSGLDDIVSIIESMSDIGKAYQAAEVLLISSRLDPLPNVAIDAMFHKKPVLCFDQATGIAEILKNGGLEKYCVAPYLDIDDISEKIQNLIESDSLRYDIGEKSYQIAVDEFNMETYVKELENIGLSLGKTANQEKKDLSTIKNSGLARMDFFLSPHISPSTALSHYVRSWASGISRRKLFPGFHPGIYLDNKPHLESNADPLADYIRHEQLEGPWSYPLLTENSTSNDSHDHTKIGLHIHAFYIDLLPEILERLNQNNVHPDLLISIPANISPGKTAKILRNYKGLVVDVATVPNTGRDIGPFFTQFGKNIQRNYEIIGHIHTKNTLSLDDVYLKLWRNFLLENLIGGKAKMADIIFANMVHDSSIGLVFPDEPNIVGWGNNKQIATSMATRLGITDLPRHFNFPVGTMFWARVDAISPLFDLNLDYGDYPEEPVPYDGTILHAIERLLPFVSNKMGYHNVLTNVEGISR